MSSAPLFSDRADAGEQLAGSLLTQINQLREAGVSAAPIVYALPRGGLPVGAAVARKLNCPLDIVVAKKITMPQNPELAIGAVTSEGHVLWLRQKRITKRNERLLQTALRQAQEKAQAQLKQFSMGCPSVNPQGALALLIDDGIATGMTIAAATQALRAKQPTQIWICAPVAPAGLMNWLPEWCDHVVVLETPKQFLSVSRFYQQFPQVETQEALSYLQTHNQLLLSENDTSSSSRASQTCDAELL
ncbi:phosphoribosyltransferase [Allocoleopsis sp.]|uniref:phosphoribosyltransferase n=1 Tax=Allocoleopsis sp. TaxID=3088169 RepID=UPI002FD3D688